MGLAGPGDEVVLIEPAYDSYRPMAEAAGAVVQTVTLAPPGVASDGSALAAAITPRTAAVMINSPLNPDRPRVRCARNGGDCARVVQQSDAVAICDEVYEHLTYDGAPIFRWRPCPGCANARCGSARRERFFAHRLESRAG